MSATIAYRIRIATLLAVACWLVWLLIDMHRTRTRLRFELSTVPSSSAAAPKPEVTALPPDPEFDRAVAIKNESIARCEVGGGIVAMGFGTHVVCLKPQCVEWTRDPHFPPLRTGLK